MPDSRAPSLFSLGMHIEHLHDDATWNHLRRALDRFERHGVRLTLYITTARSRVAGVDVSTRLAELGARPHDIGQHTHFYRRHERRGGVEEKESSLDQATVERCLREDYEHLRAAGLEPRGFTSGGFALAPHMFPWLAAHGFTHDASYRAFTAPSYEHPQPTADAPFIKEGIVEVCTTATLAGALRERATRRGGVRCHDLRYTVTYLHDYDLLDRKYRLALRAVTALRPAATRRTDGELAALVRARLTSEAAA